MGNQLDKQGDILTVVEKELVSVLQERIDKVEAISIVETVITRVRMDWGGGKHYIRHRDSKKRDNEIVKEWLRTKHKPGSQRPEIARKFDVALCTVDRAIRKYLNSRTQNNSFGSDDWVI